MAREIKIKNHKFIKKALDIKTVLEGLNYGYGVMDENCRMAEWDSVGNGLVTIYDRDHIGRGVEIVDINNKKEIELSLPMPATSYDVDVLYTLAGRIAKLWDSGYILDEDYGEKVSLKDLGNLRERDYGVNIGILAHADQFDDPMSFPSAIFPIAIENKVLQSFGDKEHYDGFAAFLHEKQSMDVYYMAPLLARLPGTDGISAIYCLIDDAPCVAPTEPLVRYTDPNGQHLTCNQYFFAYNSANPEHMYFIDFATFLKRIPKESVSPFDVKHLLLGPFSDEALKELFKD